jgi:hypothetical protein
MNDIPLIINMIGKSFTRSETGLPRRKSAVPEQFFLAVCYCKPSGKLSILAKWRFGKIAYQ